MPVWEWIGKNWSQCVTAAIALYGATLSTANLLASRKEKQRKLKVRATEAFRNINDKIIFGRYVRIINPGFRPVTLEEQFFYLPGRKSSFSISDLENDIKFPFELKEGTSCDVWTRESSIRGMLKDIGLSGKVKILVGVVDQTGKTFTDSNPIIVDSDIKL